MRAYRRQPGVLMRQQRLVFQNGASLMCYYHQRPFRGTGRQFWLLLQHCRFVTLFLLTDSVPRSNATKRFVSRLQRATLPASEVVFEPLHPPSVALPRNILHFLHCVQTPRAR